MQSKICFNKKIIYLSGTIVLFILFLIGYFSLSESLLSKKISTKSRASTPDDNLSIANGELALDNEFPYFVKIKPSKGLCGGTLISEDFVLTAAHCVYDDFTYGGVVRVMIGVNHYYGEYKGHYIGKVEHTPPKRNHNYYEFVYPENIYIPKEYKDTRLMFDKKDSYDIALLRLKTKAVGIPTLSISDVSVDELVARYPLLNPVPIIVIGVGRNEQEYLSKDLMKAPLRVNHYDGQPKSIIYLSSPRIPEQNICSGDSGGPAIFENTDGKKYVIGVTAGGYCPGYQSYYTSTSFHSEWITDITGIQPNSGTATKDLTIHPTQMPLNTICSSQMDVKGCDNYSIMCIWSYLVGKCVTHNP